MVSSSRRTSHIGKCTVEQRIVDAQNPNIVIFHVLCLTVTARVETSWYRGVAENLILYLNPCPWLMINFAPTAFLATRFHGSSSLRQQPDLPSGNESREEFGGYLIANIFGNIDAYRKQFVP